jgi:hypothetical protein
MNSFDTDNHYIRDSSVGIGTGYGLDGPGWIPGRGKIFFFPLSRPDRLWGPSIFRASGVKRPEGNADHSSPSSTEVKNGGALPPLPHMSSWPGA